MKFSIITPAYNMERWIAETIETVLSQKGNFEIEYILIDDESKDRTASIAQEYKKKIDDRTYKISCNKISIEIISQKNTGMYEAINRGFARATGDIYAWINADDTYEPGAFDAIACTYKAFPDIQWLKGITSTTNEQSEKTRTGRCKIYHQDWLAQGIYGQESYFVEQDSVFWRADLWKKAGPMPTHFRSAADYWLWIQFAQYAPLWSLNVFISNFRKREGQISKGIAKYKQEQYVARPHRTLSAWRARLFFTPQSRLSSRCSFWNNLFITLYPLLWKAKKPYSYIEIVEGIPLKKEAKSYII